MSDKAPSRFWVVMKPNQNGNVVAKFDTKGETHIDPEITNHNDFSVVSVADRSALESKTVDTSDLTDEEKQILGYSV